MDPAKMLEALLEQRRLIDATIASVGKLAATRKHRGRPSRAIIEARDIVEKQLAAGKRRRAVSVG
ncbi:MAG: hypothetical protein M3O35_18390 [Acidobacteriota bacterium]|jgi:hypothetical protein|nr:hypothetical protein [Acidobacteriota bacterium]